MNTDDIGITHAQFTAAGMAIDGPTPKPAPALAAVKSLYTTSNPPAEVIAGLREVADRLEAGEFGVVNKMAMVFTSAEGIDEVMGLGDADNQAAMYFLFACGQKVVMDGEEVDDD